MSSQPSTSNSAAYYDQYGDQTNLYHSMDYSSNLLCSMQYYNNSHNRYQIPLTNPNYGVHHHHHPPHNLHQPPCNLMDDSFQTSFMTAPRPTSESYSIQANQILPPQQQQQQSQMMAIQMRNEIIGSHSVSAPTNNSITSAVDSCQQISHVLQCYQQGGEDSEFVRKAIESLVKKLKDKRIELDSLITAVTSAGKQPTCCVTIQRSLDGRLQVAGRKGVPHVVYARIWRWPNVNKNELIKLVQCQTAPDHPDYICINPYHYERVVSNGIANIDANLHIETQQHHLKKDFDYSETNLHEFIDWPNSPHFNQGHFSQQISAQTSFDDRNFDLNQIVVPPQTQPLENWCSIIYYELDTQIGETFKVNTLDHEKVIIDGGLDPHGENEGRFCLGALSNVHRTEASEKARMHVGNGIELISHIDGNVTLISKTKVFVRSGYLDYCNGMDYGSKAHRFTPNQDSIKIFDIRWAFMQMMKRNESSNEAVRAQAAAVAGIVPLSSMPSVMPDSGVDRMRRDFCTIAISFVKGWGEMYQRRSIKETPCWIEVHLHRPLQLLDQLLKNNSSV